jgi:hypothetical protein
MPEFARTSSTDREQTAMDTESPDEHSSLSRRGVVKGAAGVAAVGAATLVASRTPALASAATSSAATTTAPAGEEAAGAGAASASGGGEGDLIVHVRNARTGEMDVYTGTRHVAVRDAALAARLAAAAR